MKSFCALYRRRLSTPAFQAKDKKKTDAEHPYHVQTYELVLKDGERDHPFIFRDPKKFLDMDGTNFDTTQSLN